MLISHKVVRRKLAPVTLSLGLCPKNLDERYQSWIVLVKRTDGDRTQLSRGTCLHMTSRQPHWCPTARWCTRPILWELNPYVATRHVGVKKLYSFVFFSCSGYVSRFLGTLIINDSAVQRFAALLPLQHFILIITEYLQF